MDRFDGMCIVKREMRKEGEGVNLLNGKYGSTDLENRQGRGQRGLGAYTSIPGNFRNIE